VGQVTAGGESKAHDGIARLDQGQQDSLVRLRAGMRLHVHELAAEQRLRAVDGELLDHVDVFAAAVIAAAGVALGILVREHRALGLQDGLGDDVLRGDHLDLILLPAELALDGFIELRIDIGQRRFEEAVTLLQGLCCGISSAHDGPSPRYANALATNASIAP